MSRGDKIQIFSIFSQYSQAKFNEHGFWVYGQKKNTYTKGMRYGKNRYRVLYQLLKIPSFFFYLTQNTTAETILSYTIHMKQLFFSFMNLKIIESKIYPSLPPAKKHLLTYVLPLNIIFTTMNIKNTNFFEVKDKGIMVE